MIFGLGGGGGLGGWFRYASGPIRYISYNIQYCAISLFRLHEFDPARSLNLLVLSKTSLAMTLLLRVKLGLDWIILLLYPPVKFVFVTVESICRRRRLQMPSVIIDCNRYLPHYLSLSYTLFVSLSHTQSELSLPLSHTDHCFSISFSFSLSLAFPNTTSLSSLSPPLFPPCFLLF